MPSLPSSSRIRHAVVAVLFMLAQPGPAFAQAAPQIVGANDLEAMAEVARGYGEAQVDRTDTDEPVILGTINGTEYQIFFLGCRAGRDCTSISFYAIWETQGTALEAINEWNRTDAFHKAYLTEDNYPVIELNASLVGGLTRANLDDLFTRWTIALAAFERSVISPPQ